MFQRYCAIAAVSFIETVRQPVFGVLLVTTVLMLILNVSLGAFTLKDDDKLLLELGLSTLLLSGLFLASFSATGVLSREIENKTVLTVIAKPVSRPLFLLGKFTGRCTAPFLAQYLSFWPASWPSGTAFFRTAPTPGTCPSWCWGAVASSWPLVSRHFVIICTTRISCSPRWLWWRPC